MKLMRTLKSILWATLILILLNNCSNSQQIIDEEPLTYQVFYDQLSPYGTWINYPDYGHVWNPSLSVEFTPYLTGGHWVATTSGWTWASDYRWGWAPFHYGRWFYDYRFGWLWVPGYEWSPAWVTWGSMDGYYCWAPLMPGVDVTILFDSWSPATFYWTICPRMHITNPHLQHVAISGVRGGNQRNIIPIRNYEKTTTHRSYYAKGPSYDEVQRETRTTITPIRIETSKRIPNLSNANRMRVYNPTIETPEAQQRRSSIPIPKSYRNAEAPRQNTNPPTIPNTQRSTQRDNIKSLPQERNTRRR